MKLWYALKTRSGGQFRTTAVRRNYVYHIIQEDESQSHYEGDALCGTYPALFWDSNWIDIEKFAKQKRPDYIKQLGVDLVDTNGIALLSKVCKKCEKKRGELL
tara:strand:+ start:551 stop:859 length:309 start_codon:yes stop_codon:yes gene_type:complete